MYTAGALLKLLLQLYFTRSN